MRRRKFEIEEFERAGHFVVRAQVPGLDPDHEIGVMVADNEVTIEVRWPVRWPGPEDGDFRDACGAEAENTFHHEPVRRTVLLPRGAKDETLTARYDRGGILEVSVELTRPAVIGRMVSVQLPALVDADVRVTALGGVTAPGRAVTPPRPRSTPSSR